MLLFSVLACAIVSIFFLVLYFRQGTAFWLDVVKIISFVIFVIASIAVGARLFWEGGKLPDKFAIAYLTWFLFTAWFGFWGACDGICAVIWRSGDDNARGKDEGEDDEDPDEVRDPILGNRIL